MKVGNCIYCKSERSLNREHAFPKSLRQRNAPGWIIDNHLCEKCNSDLGKLDIVLSQRSPIGFMFDTIQRERGQENRSIHASPYYETGGSVNPIRMLGPNPAYDDRIVLHEPGSLNHQTNHFEVLALQPQMILTQYGNGQTYREIFEENKRKYDTESLRNDNWYTHDEEDDVFCLFGNTHIFPPKTTQRYLANANDFKSKYMTDYPCIQYNLLVIPPKEGRGEQKFIDFFNALQGESKQMIPEDRNPPIGGFRKSTQVIFDPKSKLLSDRAIAKLAFHCFLFHYPKYTGHETMFNSVKNFICGGSGKSSRFVMEVETDDIIENPVYEGTKHQHYFAFFIKNNNIYCQIDLFTGLTHPPFSFSIVLAGDPDKIPLSTAFGRYFPFFVHPKSPLKKRLISVKNRIVSPNEVRIIQPSKLSGLLWL